MINIKIIKIKKNVTNVYHNNFKIYNEYRKTEKKS